MKRQPKAPVKAFSVWTCSCDDKREFSHAEFKKHLLEIHQIKTDGVKVYCQMVMHLDTAKAAIFTVRHAAHVTPMTQCNTHDRSRR